MITASDVATAPEGQPTRPRRRVRRLPIAVGIVAVALSGVGLLILEDDSNSEETLSAQSSSREFLEAASPTGVPRIRVRMGGGLTSLQNGGDIAISEAVRMGVTVDPYPPTTFDIDIDLDLTTTDGAPIADASVAIVWDMVIMGHGPFRTEFANTGGGHYQAHLDLFMFGPWELETEIDSSYDIPDDLSISLYVWPE
jgi:hypothetical protein